MGTKDKMEKCQFCHQSFKRVKTHMLSCSEKLAYDEERRKKASQHLTLQRKRKSLLHAPAPSRMKRVGLFHGLKEGAKNKKKQRKDTWKTIRKRRRKVPGDLF